MQRDQSVSLFIFLFWAVFSSAAELPKHVPESPPLPVHAWIGPPASETTPARYKELREAGFTHSFSWFPSADRMAEALDIAEAAGVKLFVAIPELRQDPEAVARRFKSHPACAGYSLRDEPSAADFAALANRARRIEKIDPSRWCYINLFPNYATAAQLGCPTYREYVNRYLQQVPVKILSFDHYPVVDTSLRPQWYENLEIIAKSARDSKKPFWAFALAVAHGSYPVAEIPHLRLQVYSNLAYGAQGIQYFTYWTVKSKTWNFNTAPLTADGKRTVVYGRVKKVNAGLRALSGVFVGAEVRCLGHTGRTLPRGTERFIPPVPIADVSSDGEGLLCSVLRNGKFEYLVIVNRTFRKAQTAALRFQEGVEVGRVLKTGAVTPLAGLPNVSIRLPAGDAALFVWRRS